jgi:hypothetical protein
LHALSLGGRRLLAADDLSRDRLYGHIKPRKRRGEFLGSLRYLRSLYPPGVRIGIVLDNSNVLDGPPQPLGRVWPDDHRSSQIRSEAITTIAW